MTSRNQQILHRKKAQRKNKRAIKELNVSVSRLEDYDIMTTRDDIKEIIFYSLLSAIEEGIKNNKKEVDLFKIKNTNSSLSIERKNWKLSLSFAINFFADNQRFEESTKCRDLIKFLLNEE